MNDHLHQRAVTVDKFRFAVLGVGCLTVICHQFIHAIPVQVQTIIMIVGIVILGIPHGAADLLIGMQTAKLQKKDFSKLTFLTRYFALMFVFCVLLLVFPAAGMMIFILLAAFHFGETDFDSIGVWSARKLVLIVVHGLMILAVILLTKHAEVMTLLAPLRQHTGWENLAGSSFEYLSRHRLPIIIILATLQILLVILQKQPLTFWWWFQTGVMYVVLWHLPLLLGFTFYFVVWHSSISLRNIVGYLKTGPFFSAVTFTKQVLFFSALAVFGISIVATAGFHLFDSSVLGVYAIFGLAVLTAPHLDVMHHMYVNLSQRKEDGLLLSP
jgi:beta-carotene 15,15'-dioxygenase